MNVQADTCLSIFSSPNHELPPNATMEDLLDLGINVVMVAPDGTRLARVAICLKHPDMAYLFTIYLNQIDQNGRQRQSHEIDLDNKISALCVVTNIHNELLTKLGPIDLYPEEHTSFLQNIEFMYYSLPGLQVRRTDGSSGIFGPN